jgi:hypothetical protein
LAGFDIGTLIAMQIVHGAPQLRVVTETVSSPDWADRLAEHLPAESPLEVDEVVWALMCDDPELFTAAAAPISELAPSAGFSLRGVHIAREGFDWNSLDTEFATRLIMIRNQLDGDQAHAVLVFGALVRAVRTVSPEQRDAVLAEADLAVLSALADADVAWAAHTEQFGDDCDPGAITAVAEYLRRHGPRKLTPAACWLAGKAAEHIDLVSDAERHFENATTADPYWEPAVADLARYAIDRGDAARALSLLDRTDAGPSTPVYALMRDAAATEHPELGRNDRCWCGSGRKYKVCHLGKSALSMIDRARLLYQKAIAHCDQLAWSRARTDLATIRARHWDTRLGWVDAVDDPLVVEVTLFECGGFDDFLRRRGGLLPDEDLLIAQQWQLAPRSVFEIESVRPGAGIALRDVRTGDRHDVHAPAVSAELRAGDFYCCHLVPVGDQMIFVGSLEPVSLSQRGRLMQLLEADTTDPREIVEFLSARFAPTQLVTSSGDPLMFCEARLTVTDPAAVRHALDEHYERDGDTDHWTWLDDQSTVLGGLHLDNSELVVNSLSENRFDTLLDAIYELAPTAELATVRRTPAADAIADHHVTTKPVPEVDFSPDDPQMAALLDAYIRDHETKWIDESIPALGGWTPRAAAADPTRRDDLIRLIDSFPQDEQPGQMSAARVRESLGLS